MAQSGHAMLVGAGAETFARECGLPLCPPEELWVGRELERWQAFHAGGHAHVQAHSGTVPSDTVGAVALDGAGNLAAATSTGGTFNKLPGRVGDSPLVGCGAYADNGSAAASATGLGEALMKVVISKTACDLVARGMAAQEAADAAIALLAERTTGTGGLIVLDRLGRVGIAHNTPHIAYATVAAGSEASAGVEYSMGKR
jgi:beta-aspartyl-peptidase (threonine type)